MIKDLAVASEGTAQDGTYVGGAGNYTNLNDWNDATYLQAGGADKLYYHSYNMEEFVAAHASIAGVSMTFRYQISTTYNQATPYVLIGGTKYYGAVQDNGDFGGVFQYTEATFNSLTNVNPATGGAWTDAVLNAAEWGIRMWGSSVSGYYNIVPDLKITVTYILITGPLPLHFNV